MLWLSILSLLGEGQGYCVINTTVTKRLASSLFSAHQETQARIISWASLWLGGRWETPGERGLAVIGPAHYGVSHLSREGAQCLLSDS